MVSFLIKPHVCLRVFLILLFVLAAGASHKVGAMMAEYKSECTNHNGKPNSEASELEDRTDAEHINTGKEAAAAIGDAQSDDGDDWVVVDHNGEEEQPSLKRSANVASRILVSQQRREILKVLDFQGVVNHYAAASAQTMQLRQEAEEGFNEIERAKQNEIRTIQSELRLQNEAFAQTRDRARSVSIGASVQRDPRQDDAAKRAARKIQELLLNCEYELNAPMKELVASFLLRRTFLNEGLFNTLEQNHVAEPALVLLDQIYNNIKEDGEIQDLSDEEIATRIEIMHVIRNMRWFVLGLETQSYITNAKLDLTVATEGLVSLIQSNRGETCSELQKCQQLLTKASDSFDLATAESPKKAADAANQAVDDIKRKLQEYQDRYRSIHDTVKSTELSEENKQLLRNRLQNFSLACHRLEVAAFAYEQLSDENWIESKTGPLLSLKQKIEGKINALMQQSGDASEVSHSLKELNTFLQSSVRTLEHKHSQPVNPIDFLDHLDKFTEAQDTDIIVGSNGKIALAKYVSSGANTVPLDEERRAWKDGGDLVRFGMGRIFGINAVGRLDALYKEKQEYGLRWHVGEVKLFYSQKQAVHESAYFLNPNDATEDLIEQLRHTKKTKLIKWDERTIAFNPFTGDSPGSDFEEEDYKARDQEKIAQGKAKAREVLRRILTEDEVPQNKIDQALERFDNEFAANPLTVRAFLSRIQSERENGRIDSESLWQQYVKPEYVKPLGVGALTGIGSLATTSIVHHLSAAALTSIGMGALFLIPPALYITYLRSRGER